MWCRRVVRLVRSCTLFAGIGGGIDADKGITDSIVQTKKQNVALFIRSPLRSELRSHSKEYQARIGTYP